MPLERRPMGSEAVDGPITIEICVADVESAIAAEAGGADRIELCDNLAVGGTTPSVGTIAEVCRWLSLPVHVLIRPRAGGFVYSERELAVMRRDIEAAKALGAAGVVLGVLDAEGRIDREQTAELVGRGPSALRHVPQGRRPGPRSARGDRRSDRDGRRPRADLGRTADRAGRVPRRSGSWWSGRPDGSPSWPAADWRSSISRR